MYSDPWECEGGCGRECEYEYEVSTSDSSSFEGIILALMSGNECGCEWKTSVGVSGKRVWV